MKILLIIQAFPPMFKIGGGVSKRYFKLVLDMIKYKKYKITLISPINILEDIDKELKYFIDIGYLTFLHIPCNIGKSKIDGIAYLINLTEPKTLSTIKTEISKNELVILDDIMCRGIIIALAQQVNVPCIVTSHTDFLKIHAFKYNLGNFSYILNYFHQTHYNTIHATVSKVFGKYNNINYTWPILIWSEKFKEKCYQDKINQQRDKWKNKFDTQVESLLLYVGRISHEKLIPLLIESVPDEAGLILIGDGPSKYCKYISKLIENKKNIIFENKTLDDEGLHLAYCSMDMLVSASDFETLGNTLIEAWAHYKPVAVLPEQGHNEYLKDKENGFEIHYKDSQRAKKELSYAVKNMKNLPGLIDHCENIKNTNFIEKFYSDLIIPAKNLKFTFVDKIISNIIYNVFFIFLFIVSNLFIMVNIISESNVITSLRD